MIQILCDLCGEPIKGELCRHYKIKEVKPLWEGFSSWEFITAHDECVKAVAAAARERRVNGET